MQKNNKKAFPIALCPKGHNATKFARSDKRSCSAKREGSPMAKWANLTTLSCITNFTARQLHFSASENFTFYAFVSTYTVLVKKWTSHRRTKKAPFIGLHSKGQFYPPTEKAETED